MSDDKSISVVNFGELAKPADTLIKKISAAVGGTFEPWQIRRVAEAKADAALIHAKAKIEIEALHQRAMHRFVEEEAKKQQNMESVIQKSLKHLDDDSNPSAMDDDWVANFFDKTRLVSDEQMQSLWAKVLAGEANSPGHFSRRAVNILANMDQRDARLFESLTRFEVVLGDDLRPFVFNSNDKIYEGLGISDPSLIHLDSIGLIHFDVGGRFTRDKMPLHYQVRYFSTLIQLEFKDQEPQTQRRLYGTGTPDDTLVLGTVVYSEPGRELRRICNADPVKGFVEYIKTCWIWHSPSIVKEQIFNQDDRLGVKRTPSF